MNLLLIADTILALILVYILVIRWFVLARKKFNCLRCGHCCRLIIEPTKEDINRLKKAGYKNFLDGKFLKKINGNCIFLKIDNGLATCKIQKVKPEICKTFPIHRNNAGIRMADNRCRFFKRKYF